MQGAQVPSLVRELDLRCHNWVSMLQLEIPHTAIKTQPGTYLVDKSSLANVGNLGSIPGPGRFHMQQMQLILCTTTIEPSSRARGATVRENTTMESSRTITEYLCSPQLEKANAKQGRSSTAINNKQKDHLKKIKKCVCVCYLLSHVWLCNLMDCSPSGSSVHGLLQGRILEWIAIPFSRGSSQPRDWTSVSCIAGRFFTD